MIMAISDKLMDDPEVTQLGLQYVLKGGKIKTDKDLLILEFSMNGELSLRKAYVELLISKGAEFSGSCRFCSEVDETFLDTNIPSGWPYGDVLDEEGTVIRTKTWREHCVVISGNLGKALILFTEKTANSGLNGDPKGLNQERLLRFRAQFPGYLVASERVVWEVVNSIESVG